jgi:predicted nucleic acid-binding protein
MYQAPHAGYESDKEVAWGVWMLNVMVKARTSMSGDAAKETLAVADRFKVVRLPVQLLTDTQTSIGQMQ